MQVVVLVDLVKLYCGRLLPRCHNIQPFLQVHSLQRDIHNSIPTTATSPSYNRVNPYRFMIQYVVVGLFNWLFVQQFCRRLSGPLGSCSGGEVVIPAQAGTTPPKPPDHAKDSPECGLPLRSIQPKTTVSLFEGAPSSQISMSRSSMFRLTN